MTKLTNEQVMYWTLAMDIHTVMVQAGYIKLALDFMLACSVELQIATA